MSDRNKGVQSGSGQVRSIAAGLIAFLSVIAVFSARSNAQDSGAPPSPINSIKLLTANTLNAKNGAPKITFLITATDGIAYMSTTAEMKEEFIGVTLAEANRKADDCPATR